MSAWNRVRRKLRSMVNHHQKEPWRIGCSIFIILASSLPIVQGQCFGGVETYEKSSQVTFASVNNVQGLLSQPGTAVTRDCAAICKQTASCAAFTVDYSTSRCQAVDREAVSRRDNLKDAAGVNYFEKICLRGVTNFNAICGDRLWAFERVLGASLQGFDDREEKNVLSRAECAKLCLEQTEFVCRSAEYDPVQNVCRLSKEDRRTQPSAFRKMEGSSVDYLENQCVRALPDCRYATKNDALVTSMDQIEFAQSQGECESLCDQTRAFTCRSFGFLAEENRCYLSGDDAVSLASPQGPPPMPQRRGALYAEKICTLSQCEGGIFTFEKVSGHFLRSARTEPLPLAATASPGVTLDCARLCLDAGADCPAFSLDYASGRCQRLDRNSQGRNEDITPRESRSYFEKVCLRGNVGNCRDRIWAFDRVPGKELRGFDDRIIKLVQSRRDCEESCLQETRFVCASAEYDSQTTECRLSSEHRRSRPLEFTDASPTVDYLENQCLQNDRSCGFKMTENSYPRHLDVVLPNTADESQCQASCVNYRPFLCRAFSYYPAASQCFLSADDTASLGNLALQSRPGTNYSERNCDRNLTDFNSLGGGGSGFGGTGGSNLGPFVPNNNNPWPTGPPSSGSTSFGGSGSFPNTSPPPRPWEGGGGSNFRPPTAFGGDDRCRGTGSVHFERVVGQEPVPLGRDQLLHRDAGTPPLPASGLLSTCGRRCVADPRCAAFLVDLRRGECRSFETTTVVARRDWRQASGVVYMESVCLRGQDCGLQWTFDRIPQAELRGFEREVARGIASRLECQERCLSERQFTCRSANYDARRQECRLNTEDRTTQPKAFQPAPDIEYLENQCNLDVRSCRYTLPQRDRIPGQIDKALAAISEVTCQRACDVERDFRCRAYAFSPLGSTRDNCLLSSIDSPLAPITQAQFQAGWIYAEKDCLLGQGSNTVSTNTFVGTGVVSGGSGLGFGGGAGGGTSFGTSGTSFGSSGTSFGSSGSSGGSFGSTGGSGSSFGGSGGSGNSFSSSGGSFGSGGSSFGSSGSSFGSGGSSFGGSGSSFGGGGSSFGGTGSGVNSFGGSGGGGSSFGSGGGGSSSFGGSFGSGSSGVTRVPYNPLLPRPVDPFSRPALPRPIDPFSRQPYPTEDPYNVNAIGHRPDPRRCRTYTTFEKSVNVDHVGARRQEYRPRGDVAVTPECLRECERLGERCLAMTIVLETGRNSARQRCFLLDRSATTDGVPLTTTPNTVYYEKVCVEERGCSKAWAFVRVPGFELDGHDTQILRNVPTREACLGLCLRQPPGSCRSAEYVTRERICRISTETRRTQPRSFQAATTDVDYMENQCTADPPHCEYENIEGRWLPWVDKLTPVAGRSGSATELMAGCRRLCDAERDFVCRAVSLHRGRGLCLLSAEDTTSLGGTPGSASTSAVLQTDREFMYSEKGSCNNVRVECSQSDMLITLAFTAPFSGRVYATGNAQACFELGNGQNQLILRIPLGSQCGTVAQGRGRYVNHVVVQQNPVIMQDTDKTVRVECSFDAAEQTVSYAPSGGRFGDNSLGSAGGIDVTVPFRPTGTNVVTNTAPTPGVRMRIVSRSGSEAQVVGLGELLTLRIEVDPATAFGIFGRNLEARTENGELMTLIDGSGCPRDPNIFPALRVEHNTRSLIADFKAFRFPSTATVNFVATVTFCQDRCPPARCVDGSDSYGRRRRDLNSTEDEEESLFASQFELEVPSTTPVSMVLNSSQESIPVQEKYQDETHTSPSLDETLPESSNTEIPSEDPVSDVHVYHVEEAPTLASHESHSFPDLKPDEERDLFQPTPYTSVDTTLDPSPTPAVLLPVDLPLQLRLVVGEESVLGQEESKAKTKPKSDGRSSAPTSPPWLNPGQHSPQGGVTGEEDNSSVLCSPRSTIVAAALVVCLVQCGIVAAFVVFYRSQRARWQLRCKEQGMNGPSVESVPDPTPGLTDIMFRSVYDRLQRAGALPNNLGTISWRVRAGAGPGTSTSTATSTHQHLQSLFVKD